MVVRHARNWGIALWIRATIKMATNKRLTTVAYKTHLHQCGILVMSLQHSVVRYSQVLKNEAIMVILDHFVNWPNARDTG